MRMDNIILIGMPAAGKSTIGVIIAKRLGYQFVDVDLLIQEKEGKLLKEIIAQKGIKGFLEVEDQGRGIEDVEQAMEPLFTTKPELDRSGMGFSFMEAFMDDLEVISAPGKGTCVKMKKVIGKGRKLWTTQSL